MGALLLSQRVPWIFTVVHWHVSQHCTVPGWASSTKADCAKVVRVSGERSRHGTSTQAGAPAGDRAVRSASSHTWETCTVQPVRKESFVRGWGQVVQEVLVSTALRSMIFGNESCLVAVEVVAEPLDVLALGILLFLAVHSVGVLDPEAIVLAAQGSHVGRHAWRGSGRSCRRGRS